MTLPALMLIQCSGFFWSPVEKAVLSLQVDGPKLKIVARNPELFFDRLEAIDCQNRRGVVLFGYERTEEFTNPEQIRRVVTAFTGSGDLSSDFQQQVFSILTSLRC